MNLPKMFVFDLDGVITDTAKYHFEAWKMLADELDLKFILSDNERLKGVSRIRCFEIILEINDVVSKFTSEEKEHYANKKNSYYVKLINNVTPDDILEGIVPLLTKARENDIKTSIASASRNAFTVLEKLGLLQSFDYIADANKISNSKPHPEVFLNCANALNIDTSECIGFEDADAGIQAIYAAGMFSVGINVTQESEDSVLPDYSVKRTLDLDFDKIVKEYSNNIR